MGEFILFLLIFVGIMVVSALIFGGWFIVMIVRGIASTLSVARPARSKNISTATGPWPARCSTRMTPRRSRRR